MNSKEKEVIQYQLNREKEVIKELKGVYERALYDTEIRISELMMRKDLDPAALQTVIYQQRYQEIVKAQINGALEILHSDSYSTISDYVAKCYENGFMGAMYDLSGQGIPLLLPINQAQVVKAIQLDSRLSNSLYTSLGQDINKLKTAVRREISRGIAAGATWNTVASNLAKNFKNTPFSKAYNRSVTIARTEGHRVQIEAQLDAMKASKEKGASIVKQWDATLDGLTRPHHAQLDGQVRELEAPFEVDGLETEAPSEFGIPAEDCNCRCQLLQRATWSLDSEELNTLRERASYFGTNAADSKEYGKAKAKDFSDFKKNYESATEAMSKYYKALEKEPAITSDMKEISDETGVELYGLENRIKSEDSYIRKLDTHGIDYDISDIIRYTCGTQNPDNYVNNYYKVIDALEKKGYTVDSVENYWIKKGNAYNGINTVVLEKDGQKFEIQYHTKESFEIKQKMHPFYEKQRLINDANSNEYNALSSVMIKIASNIKVPSKIEEIKNVRSVR